jgi:mono/diheme cytochrome c family protein/uncharacterized membrane protein
MMKWEFLGRLHPLVLHLPIGLIFGLCLLEVLSVFVDAKARVWQVFRRAYIGLLALSSIVAATTGYILSLEGQHSGATLYRHRWLGIAVAVLSVVLLTLAAKRESPLKGCIQAVFRFVLVLVLFAGILVTGHLGGQLTHGPRFLAAFAPRALQPFLGPALLETPATRPEAPVTVYQTLIQPILDDHCILCHGPDQRKAQLAVHRPDALMAGARSGPVIVPGDALGSEFFKRIQLPPDQAGHMPPAGKSQLSSVQISALEWWIQEGASADTVLDKNDIPREVLGLLPQPDTTEPSMQANMPSQWDEGLVRRLLDRQISIQRIKQDDPRLWISFPAISDQVTDETVQQLLPLAPFIAWLDLSNTRITSESLPWISQMPVLTELNLRQTDINADALKALAQHPRLERLNLSGVPLDDTVVDTLLAMPSLKRVYLWESQVSKAGIQRLMAPRIEVIAETIPSDIISTDPNDGK